MKLHLETTLTVILVGAAVVMATAIVHREFLPNAGRRSNERKSEYVSEWRRILPAARLIGNRDARVTVVEFTDFECPFCRRFNTALLEARRKHPNDVAVALVHFPLPNHQHAFPAARAAECAHRLGRFGETVDAIFENQSQLGLHPWVWFASTAGIADTGSFVTCMQDTTTPPMIQAGLSMGERLSVRSTPTVILNGWRYGGAPSDTEFVRAVEDILAGRSPYRGFPKSKLLAQ